MKRKWIAVFALGLAAPAGALELPESMAQPSLQLSVGFGAPASTPLAQRLHYRLQLDPQWRDERDPVPAVVALEFTHAGLAEARLGGVPLKATTLMLSQTEGAEAPGLRFWKWGLQQWGMVAGAGIIAVAAGSYEDPSGSDPQAAAEETTACGSDVPQPVFADDDCI
jgi:hypothetical protein